MIDPESKGRIALAIIASGLAASSVGCGAADDSRLEEMDSVAVSQPIVNGQAATSYPEAALINGPGYACSGAIIAPRIALTAGHCVDANQFTVVAPYANQRAKSSKKWTEYVSQGQYVNPQTKDVGIIILDTPITLSWYPPLATSAAPDGTKAVNVGRIKNGQLSSSGLFYGKQVTLKNASANGFPFSYMSEEVIESGDSGGPVYMGAGADRAIVAVNSGGGNGTQVLARVDLVYDKIQQLIADNGGSSSGGSSSGGSSSGGSSSGTSSGGTSSGGSSSGGSSSGGSSSGGTSSGGTSSGSSGGACTSTESEPNNEATAANALGAKTCGELATSADVDWFTWEVSASGVAYDVSLTATGDAEIVMWKYSNNAWRRIANNTSTRIAATSTGAGRYVVGVSSPSTAAQSYSLSLRK